MDSPYQGVLGVEIYSDELACHEKNLAIRLCMHEDTILIMVHNDSPVCTIVIAGFMYLEQSILLI